MEESKNSPVDQPCDQRRNGVCGVASELARQPVTPHRSACELCLRSSQPRALNRYTLAIAVGALLRSDPAAAAALRQKYEEGMAVEQVAARLAAILAGTGPGSQLWRLLKSLGVRHTPTCPCLGFAERMNAWGVAGCRLARAEIVEHMRTHAQAYGWGTFVQAAGRAVLTGLAWRIDLTDPYGSLVDEAIRRAEAASVPSIPVVP